MNRERITLAVAGVFRTAVLAGLLFGLGAGLAFGADSLPPDNPKYRTIKGIYDNVARAFGDSRKPPRLMVRPKEAKGGMQIAFFFPGSAGAVDMGGRIAESYISVDEKVYDLLAEKLRGDLENGLAVLLSHELTHYYNRHGWVGEFGNAFADTELGKGMAKTASLEEANKYEAEADYFGGFYGFVAGYNTLGLAPRVVDLIYDSYKLPEKLTNYPSRKERKEIAARSEESLRKMVPLFEAANRLLLLKKYDEAGRLFDFIAETFPSREIFNNAGVALALAAVDLAKSGEVKFAYPFEFDAKSRLTRSGTRGKGVADDTHEKQLELLKLAAEAFDKAKARDVNYAAAYVNRAAVHELAGEHQFAVLVAGMAMDVAAKQNEQVTLANAFLVRGIAYASSGENAKAAADFASAQKGAPLLASVNADVLKAMGGEATAMGYAAEGAGKAVDAPKKPVEIVSMKGEKIGGVGTGSTDIMETNEVTGFSLKGAGQGEATLKVFARATDAWSGIAVDSGTFSVFVLSTPQGYKGKTARGLGIGSSARAVREKYGEPTRTVSSRQGTYLVYEQTQIIFLLGPDDQVDEWMIYAEL